MVTESRRSPSHRTKWRLLECFSGTMDKNVGTPKKQLRRPKKTFACGCHKKRVNSGRGGQRAKSKESINVLNYNLLFFLHVKSLYMNGAPFMLLQVAYLPCGVR
ncbi:hypothetical protein V5799_030800 [Amblyomma americanum]|uniref:Uncharacterized protein n=1 Tax=Amblyomma americanum TaxID=6943 RepID=A0AAQ4EM51_AMBAM